MPRTLFSRLLIRGLLVLLTLLAAAGFVLDRFLAEREVDRLADNLEIHARGVNSSLPAAGSAELQPRIRRVGAATDLRFTLIRSDGQVLADSHHDPASMDDHSTRPEIAAAIRGHTGRSIRRSPTLGLDMLYVALPGEPVVRAAMPLLDVQGYLWQIRKRVLWAVLPAVILSLGLAYLLSRSLTGRFARMNAAAVRLAAGDYQTPVTVAGRDDLSELERSLASLRTELAQQVGALQRDRERLRSLLDGLPDAVLLLDGDRRVTVANTPARQLLRMPEERLLGLPGAEVLREPRILAALDAFSVAGPGDEPLEMTWPQPRCDLELTLHPLPDEQGRPGVLVVLRDISRRVHLEKVRTDFIANLSHELRTPLTAIRGAAETLEDGALQQPEVAQRFLGTIVRHSVRLENLLSDVSDLARIEAGGAPNVLEQLDARDLLHRVTELFGTEAERRGVRLLVAPPPAPLPLVSDPNKIESLLVNLVQNGLRYTAEGGEVRLSVEATEGGACYRVEDTGVGIPPQDLARVTERFYRVDPSRSRAQGGTGLGLSIVKHLVDELNGHLDITSEYQQGTVVTVRLASLEAPEAREAPPKAR